MEKNKFKRMWIWLCYNDVTRLMILLGLPVIPIVILFGMIFGVGEYLRWISGLSYLFLFGWGVLDNDYSNLHRIGLDVYRRKIKENK